MRCGADLRSDMTNEPIINEATATGADVTGSVVDSSGGYLPPISFQELHQAGRISMPYAEEYSEGYGPLGDSSLDGSTTSESMDPLEAFVDAWAHAGPSPTTPLLP